MIYPATPAALAEAAHRLKSGQLVAFPTETVYGLGGDATNDRAVAAIYEAKGRPQFNPLIAHVADTEQLDTHVVWNKTARRLADAYWPGPLTLILPRAPQSTISLLASAGLDTLAVRQPAHVIARDLLRLAGTPIAAPSANASGKLSPTCAEDVLVSLGSAVDFILSGGQSDIGVESTVLDLTTDTPNLLRPGGLSLEDIEETLKIKIRVAHETQIKSPGMISTHYAPNAYVRLNALSADRDEAFLLFGNDALFEGGHTRLNLSPSGNIKEAAAHLFSMLRHLDALGVKGIAVAPIPESGLGLAINDRLLRAAAPRNATSS